jgi:hypothetical protein
MKKGTCLTAVRYMNNRIGEQRERQGLGLLTKYPNFLCHDNLTFEII